MSVSGILSSSLSSYNVQSMQSQMKQFQQEFQQLGTDLQSGNLTTAQSDYAALQPSSSATQTSSSPNTGSIAQAFNQLGTDLQSGNLTAAQQDYSTIQQDAQNQSSQVHHHHHHHGGGGSQENAISQMFQQLGQDLQSGQLSAAQQAYGSLQQDLQQLTPLAGASSNASSVSLSA